jgi:hypothetical protein
MQNAHDHSPAVYKVREHNCYPIAPSMGASVILASCLPATTRSLATVAALVTTL